MWTGLVWLRIGFEGAGKLSSGLTSSGLSSSGQLHRVKLKISNISPH
jgi:hypothetical protein